MSGEKATEQQVLLQAATSGSFTAAAKALGVSVSTVTRAVGRVERGLGAKLFSRTADGIQLTEAGQLYLEHVREAVHAEAEARATIDSLVGGDRGSLRISVPMFVARRVLPDAVEAFLGAHPDVRLTVHSSDDRVDLLGGGFDLAIRLGPLSDSTLHARRLARYRAVLLASRNFRHHCRHLRHPAELSRLPCIAYGAGAGRVVWGLRSGTERIALPVNPILRSNDVDLLARTAAAGLGVTLLPEWVLPHESLHPILDGWSAAGTLHAVYPADPGKARLRNALIHEIARAAKRGPVIQYAR